MARDYYEILGVQRNASKSEIKSAFRQLARQYHPDVSDAPDAEQKFKEIGEAYDVLSDDNKRARYDRFGHAGVGNNSGFGGTGFAGMGFEEIFEEFFSTFGGRSRRRRGPRAGADKVMNVSITFEEAYFGVEKTIELNRLETCDTCNGSGADSDSNVVTCPQCNGSGEIRQVQQTYLVGSMVRVTACPRCDGSGTVIENPCKTCTGSGRVRKRPVLNVPIPGGASDGLQFQIPGEGDAGERGAPPGSLFVVVNVKPHKFFKRRDNDIILDISINIAQAALGDKVVVPTVEGDVDLTIPTGTQTGKVFRLTGRGFPRLKRDGTSSGRGDQLVYVTVGVPTSLTDEQRELFERLGETLGSDIQPQTNGRGFFDRVMNFFGSDQN